MPKTLQSIGEDAFIESGIRSIVIPDSINAIGARAFGYCFNLRTVTLPRAQIDISDRIFEQCGLTHITAPYSNPPVVSESTFCYWPSVYDTCNLSILNDDDVIAAYMADPIWSQFRKIDYDVAIQTEMDDEYVDASIKDKDSYDETKEEIIETEEEKMQKDEDYNYAYGDESEPVNIKSRQIPSIDERVVEDMLLKTFAPVFNSMVTTCNEGNSGQYINIKTKHDAQIIKVEFDGKDITSQLKDGMILLPAVKKSGKLKITTDKDGTSGIGTTVVNQGEKGVLYDLCGRRVHNPGKGIYIKDGKKVVL